MPVLRNTTNRGIRGARVNGRPGPLLAPGQSKELEGSKAAAFKGVEGVVVVEPELSPRKAAEKASADLKASAVKKPKAGPSKEA